MLFYRPAGACTGGFGEKSEAGGVCKDEKAANGEKTAFAFSMKGKCVGFHFHPLDRKARLPDVVHGGAERFFQGIGLAVEMDLANAAPDSQGAVGADAAESIRLGLAWA